MIYIIGMDSKILKEMLLIDSLSEEERVAVARNLVKSASKEDLEFLGKLANGSDTFLKRAAIEGLGAFNHISLFFNLERTVYDTIFPHLTDDNPEVRRCAILSLGELGNSRTLFPLVNLYQGGNLQTRNSILHALNSFKDPRSKEFLESIDDELSDFAHKIAANIDPDALNYYSFSGDERMYDNSLSVEEQVQINSSKDLDLARDILDQNRRDFPSRPQTYIVTPKLKFVIGGNLHEHVYVAKGNVVVAAGEVRLEHENGLWEVKEINNRSNGYHPGSSYKWVRTALDKAKIKCPDEFTEIFPKEGYFTEDFLNLQPLADYRD